MKWNLTLFLLVAIALQTTWAGDVLKLTNGKAFDGDVKRINDCEVVFKTAGTRYHIPAQDILFIRFADPDDRVLEKYLALSAGNKCLKGRTDADMYHGKDGLNFAMGVLFGPFAVIGAALTNPRPETGNKTLMRSQNDNLFDDPNYLQCYKKKAKKSNAGNAALGWLTWVVILLL